MAWINALDNATPAGSDAPSSIDDQIRLVKAALQERLNADHYWPLTGTAVSDTDAGKHRKLTAKAVLSIKPTLLTGEAALYTKTVSGVSEWFWEDSAGTEHQLTSAGKLNVVEADLTAILKDEDNMASNSATSIASQQSIKAYVNAQVAAAVAAYTTMVPAVTGAGTGYAGEESVTYQNGEIKKRGYTVIGATSGTITFAVAFPTGVVALTTTLKYSGSTLNTIIVKDFTVVDIDWACADSGMTGFWWEATGY